MTPNELGLSIKLQFEGFLGKLLSMIVEFLLCVVTAPLTPVVDRLLNNWGATSSNNVGIEGVSDTFLDEHVMDLKISSI